MPPPNSISATLNPNSSRQVTFIFMLHGWTHKHPAPDRFPAVVHLISVCRRHTALTRPANRSLVASRSRSGSLLILSQSGFSEYKKYQTEHDIQGMLGPESRHLKQPPLFAECRKINSRRGIPSPGAITGAKLQSDLLVAIRNSQWRRA
jgi:hypothetical protein